MRDILKKRWQNKKLFLTRRACKIKIYLPCQEIWSNHSLFAGQRTVRAMDCSLPWKHSRSWSLPSALTTLAGHLLQLATYAVTGLQDV